MKDENPLKAGTFIFICLIAFAIGIVILGKERHIFARNAEFSTTFKDVSGLSDGAPVRIGGITTGRVSRIGFSKDLTDRRVKVRLLVDQRYLDRIRQDSLASIETQGLLGDKYVSISPGSPEMEALESGTELQSRDAADLGNLVSKAQTIVENVTQVSEKLAQTIGGLDKETFKSISAGARGFASLAEEVKKGDGLVHRLFYSKKDADRIMNNLTKSSESLNDILIQIKSGDGFLHSVIYEKTDKDLFKNLSQATEALGETASLVSSIAEEIKTGDGLLHQVVFEKTVDLAKIISDTATKLNDSAVAIKRASEALANGDGTIGALLVDSKLYDNLVQVTDGAKRSIILREAIRSSLAKTSTKDN